MGHYKNIEEQTSEMRIKKGFAVVLFNLFIVAMMGLLLRTLHVVNIPQLNYTDLLQGHSHFAFGGWGFMALSLALYHAFLPKNKAGNKSYLYIFWLAFIMTWGMLISFPFKGYAAVSTTFSTLYIFVTYWFAGRFYKDIKAQDASSISLRFARAAVFFLVFSSIGPFTMAGIMISGNGSNPLAMNAIYFYLHFQYNGWLIFGIIALFFKWLETHSFQFSQKQGLLFFRLMFWSCIPAYLLSVLWSKPSGIFFFVAGMAGVVQLLAVLSFFKVLLSCKKKILHGIQPIVKWMATFIWVMFVLKNLLQFLSAFPVVETWIGSVRNLIIAYLHLVLLGVFTLFLLTYMIEAGILKLNKTVKTSMIIFLAGFVLTEAVLFMNASLALMNSYFPSFDLWMLLTTILLPLGVLILFTDHCRKIYQHHPYIDQTTSKIKVYDDFSWNQ